MDLSTTARVKSMANISGTSRDTLIAALVTAYSAEFERAMDRHAQSSSRTEYVRLGRYATLVQLRGVPISAVTTLKLSSSRDFTGASALTENTDYVANLEGGSLELASPPGSDPCWAQIVYTGGMAADQSAFTTAFPSLSTALDVQVCEHIKRMDNGTMEGSFSDQGGQSSPLGAYTLNKHTIEMLRQYRRVYV